MFKRIVDYLKRFVCPSTRESNTVEAYPMDFPSTAPQRTVLAKGGNYYIFLNDTWVIIKDFTYNIKDI